LQHVLATPLYLSLGGFFVMTRSSRLLVLVAALFCGFAFSSPGFAEPVTTVCPKCGKVHAQPAASSPTTVIQNSTTSVQPTSTVVQASFQPAQPVQRASSGVSNVLATLNAQRARQGVGQLAFDPQLQAVAERRAATMARTGMKSHPPGSFAPGRYEGVGWSSSFSPSGVSACFTSDSRMRVAGAAMATGRDGVYFAVVYR
jgi:hypothetical protein